VLSPVCAGVDLLVLLNRIGAFGCGLGSGFVAVLFCGQRG
jgi:hypothetical protein